MKNKLFLLAASLAFASLDAAVITYDARGNARPADANGNFLADNSLVRIGTFTEGFNFTLNGKNLSALQSAFTQFGLDDATETEAAATPRVGSISTVSTPNILNISGQKIYFWIFNGTTALNSTQWGIFTNNTNTEWTAKANDPVLDVSIISLGNTGIVPVVGGTFVRSTTTTGQLAVIEAIPEPSTYALMGLGLVVVGFLARRRK